MDFGHCLYKRIIYLLCSISNSRNPQFIILYICVLTLSCEYVSYFAFGVSIGQLETNAKPETRNEKYVIFFIIDR